MVAWIRRHPEYASPAGGAGLPDLYPDNEAAFRALAKIGTLEVLKTETFPVEKVDVFFKAFV